MNLPAVSIENERTRTTRLCVASFRGFVRGFVRSNLCVRVHDVNKEVP